MLLKYLYTSDKAGGSQTHFFLQKSFAGFRTCTFTHGFLIATIGSKHRKTGPANNHMYNCWAKVTQLFITLCNKI